MTNVTSTGLKVIFSKFSKTSIKFGDDGHYLYGHNINVQWFGDTWDIYLCNMKEYAKGNRKAYLGTKKLNNIYATLPKSIQVHKLDGESWFNTTNIEWLKSWLLKNHKTLAVRLAGYKSSSSFKPHTNKQVA